MSCLARAAPVATALTLLAWEATAQTGRIDGRVLYSGSPAAGAVVYLERLDRARRPPPAASSTSVLDQVHLRFVPAVLVVPPGTEVTFLNSDPLMHNVFGPGSRGGDRFNLGTYPEGATRGHVFDQSGVHTILCHIHPEMVAYVVVVPAAYSTTAEKDGSFALRDIDPGRYRLTAWHPRRFNRPGTREVVAAPGERTFLTITLDSPPTTTGN